MSWRSKRSWGIFALYGAAGLAALFGADALVDPILESIPQISQDI